MDTMMISWLFDERPNRPADRYRELIGVAPVLLAFQTVMELRLARCVPGGVSSGGVGLSSGSGSFPSCSPMTR